MNINLITVSARQADIVKLFNPKTKKLWQRKPQSKE